MTRASFKGQCVAAGGGWQGHRYITVHLRVLEARLAAGLGTVQCEVWEVQVLR
jgi:hypothetical protein